MSNRFLTWFQGHRLFGRFANRGFFNYFWVGVVISLTNVVVLWILIDLLNIPTIVSSVVVVGGTFIGRYLLFQRFPVA